MEQNIQNNQNGQQQGPDGPIIIGVGTSTDKQTARQEAEEFIKEIGNKPQQKLNLWQRMAARRMARELRKLYKETNGAKGISEETFQEILKVLKEMR